MDAPDTYQDFMDDRQAGHGARSALGPSSVSKCYRQAAYEYLDVQPSDVRSTSAADLGTLMHLGYSALIGSRYDPAERAADVTVQPTGLPRPGEADDVDYVNRVVTDLKTARGSVYEAWGRNGVYEHYWQQLEVYALGLREQHGGDWTLRVLALNRETGEHCEYERPADPDVGRALVDRIAERHAALTAAATTVLAHGDSIDPLGVAAQFPREGKGPGRGMPCDHCSFLSVCWPQPVTGDGTPQSATMDPEDAAAIANLASEYLTLRQQGKKAYDASDDIKPFLSGLDVDVPDPHDPEYELTVHMAGGSPKQVLDCEAMAEKLESLGYAPIVKDTTTARYVKVGRRKRRKR
jgi:hypothetical protein